MKYLVVISLEESEERSLSSGRSLDSSESNIISSSLDVSKIPEQFLSYHLISVSQSPECRRTNLNPKGASFPDGRQLSRLEVGPSKSR